MKWLVFAVVLAACATPSILVDSQAHHGCGSGWSPCVDGNVQPTGYCCPESYACSGPPPNVGCGTKIGDSCCPTAGSVGEYMTSVRQRAAK